MKMKPEHVGIIRTAINSVLTADPGLPGRYREGDFPRSDRVKDLQKRFNWDLLWKAGLSKFVSQELYPYLNDDHINTALKQICPKL